MKSIVIFVALIFLIGCKDLNVTCGDCSSTANCTAGSKCYKLTATGLDKETCVAACPWNTTVPYAAYRCTVDILGQSCPVGVCFSTNAATCLGSGGCVDIQSESKCGACQSTPGCTYCLKTTLSIISVESCLDSFINETCSWSSKTKIAACTGDAYGATCDCCTSTQYKDAGVCASSNPISSPHGAELQTWAYQGLFQQAIVVTLAVLMMIFY